MFRVRTTSCHRACTRTLTCAIDVAGLCKLLLFNNNNNIIINLDVSTSLRALDVGLPFPQIGYFPSLTAVISRAAFIWLFFPEFLILSFSLLYSWLSCLVPCSELGPSPCFYRSNPKLGWLHVPVSFWAHALLLLSRFIYRCDFNFKKVINIQGVPKSGTQVLILR